MTIEFDGNTLEYEFWTVESSGDEPVVAIVGGSEIVGDLTIPAEIGGKPVTSIGYSAFSRRSGLMSITIPKGITDIAESAFYGCSGLKTFVVHPDNPAYQSVSGLLLTKDGKTLVAGVNGDVAVPDGVTFIDYQAFSSRCGLTSVIIPDSVKSIDHEAFQNCYGLTSVTIPDSVTEIGSSAFDDCSGLKRISLPKRLKGKLDFSGCPEDMKITYRD